MNSDYKNYYITAIIIGVVGFVLVLLYPIFVGFHPSSDSKHWADFGQYTAGVIGSLLMLLAFVGVLLTIANQNKENSQNNSENKKQYTENRIIKHIEFHHHICGNVRIPYDIKETKFREGRIAFAFLFDKVFRTFYDEVKTKNSHLDEEQILDNTFSKLYQKHGRQFGFYFRNLFYLIKYIDESVGIDKIHYSRLVRAQLSTSEIQLLMYNCLYKKGKGFKSLVENYSLLNGIDETEMIDKEHKKSI
ncbi:MAG: putative phage abortive infection protein [Bacteroidales bacterium]